MHEVIPTKKTTGRRAVALRKPKWDGQARQLGWGGAVIKTYRPDAANQRAVLEALQDAGWPPRIDDPLRLCKKYKLCNGAYNRRIPGYNPYQSPARAIAGSEVFTSLSLPHGKKKRLQSGLRPSYFDRA